MASAASPGSPPSPPPRPATPTPRSAGSRPGHSAPRRQRPIPRQLAAFCWVTWSICADRRVELLDPRRLLLGGGRDLPMRSTTLPAWSRSGGDLPGVSPFGASRTFATDSSISRDVFLAASAARMARLRTSSATTANPAPASPARAASTAALSASRFVWKAISSMVLTILPVSALVREISPRGRQALGHLPVGRLHRLALRGICPRLIGVFGVLPGHGRHFLERGGGLLDRGGLLARPVCERLAGAGHLTRPPRRPGRRPRPARR